jgi:hypothetical protein
MAERIAEADPALGTRAAQAQPAANAPDAVSAPLQLADAAQAVSVVGQSANTSKRASAA